MKDKLDTKDPFVVGQMVGMLVMLTFLEGKDIPEDVLFTLKQKTADKLQDFFQKPTEDIHLIIESIVKEIT